jgi:biotin carboxyl carrier protein
MYTISINGKQSLKTDLNIRKNNFTGMLDGKEVQGDFVKINDYQYHLLYKGQSYNIDVVKLNREEKTLVLRINSRKVNLQLRDKYDELLHNLGMDALASKKVNDIKAPMPGMVLNILVHEGSEVKKGDALLVLEAMKMENIIKSPCDGVVKRVAANKGIAVEKNQLLIQF